MYEVRDDLKSTYAHYYDEGQSEWRRIGALRKADNVVAMCGSLPHSKILDVGSGEGALLERLHVLGFADEMWSLEISESGIEAIKDRGIPSLVEAREFNGYDIPYADDFFDLVTLSHVVEHVEHPRKLLYEAARVGRRVFIEVPLEDNWRLSQHYVANGVGHINYYSPKTLRHLVQTCGLKVISQEVRHVPLELYRYSSPKTGPIKYWLKQMLLKSLPSVATNLMTYHGAVLCTKEADA